MRTFFIVEFKLIVLFCLVATTIVLAKTTPDSAKHLAVHVKNAIMSIGTRFDLVRRTRLTHTQPALTLVQLSAFAAFKGSDHFYNLAFHELTYWTAHPSRLSRDLKHRFGSRDYAAEELVA